MYCRGPFFLSMNVRLRKEKKRDKSHPHLENGKDLTPRSFPSLPFLRSMCLSIGYVPLLNSTCNIPPFLAPRDLHLFRFVMIVASCFTTSKAHFRSIPTMELYITHNGFMWPFLLLFSTLQGTMVGSFGIYQT